MPVYLKLFRSVSVHLGWRLEKQNKQSEMKVLRSFWSSELKILRLEARKMAQKVWAFTVLAKDPASILES